MPDLLDKEIAMEIRRIAGRAITVLSGKVVSVDADSNDAKVQLTYNDASDGGDAVPTDGVLLNVSTANMSGMYMVPANGADCIVAQIDGPGQWTLLQASAYTKVMITVGGSKVSVVDGTVQFNDGSLNGLVVVGKLLEKLNNLEKDNNNLKQVFSALWTPVPNDGGAALKAAAATWAGSTLTVTQQADIENTKIKQ